jgi:hypothetical protein
MRKINWDEKLSGEDIEWLRSAGHVSEEQIAAHQAQFDAEVPDAEVPEDETTLSALDPTSSAATPANTGDGVKKVDPTLADPQDAIEDDYEQWTVKELNDEVEARNAIPDTGEVTVEGTGSNGKVTKADLIKGLRLWDAENPTAED